MPYLIYQLACIGVEGLCAESSVRPEDGAIRNTSTHLVHPSPPWTCSGMAAAWAICYTQLGKLCAREESRRRRAGPVAVTWRSIDVLAKKGTSRTSSGVTHKVKQAVQPFVSWAWTASLPEARRSLC